MLTWRWVGARGNGLGRSIVSQTAVSIVGKGTFRGDHSGGDPTAVVRRGRRQIGYPCLRVRMMMSGRVHRMVMPRRRVRRVIAPALGEALMAGGDGRVGGTGGGPTTAGGRRRGSRTGRVVGLVIRGRAGGAGRAGSGGRPEAKGGPDLPVVPGGTGTRGWIGRQIVIRGGIVPPVGLMMVQGFAAARRGRVVGVLGMVRAVTPAALRARRRRVRVPYDARRPRASRSARGLYAGNLTVGGPGAPRGRR